MFLNIQLDSYIKLLKRIKPLFLRKENATFQNHVTVHSPGNTARRTPKFQISFNTYVRFSRCKRRPNRRSFITRAPRDESGD